MRQGSLYGMFRREHISSVVQSHVDRGKKSPPNKLSEEYLQNTRDHILSVTCRKVIILEGTRRKSTENFLKVIQMQCWIFTSIQEF